MKELQARIRPASTANWYYAEVLEDGRVVASKACVYALPWRKASRAARTALRLLQDYETARRLLR